MDKLTSEEKDQFIELGYVRIDSAFPTGIAQQCRSILWKAIQLNPDSLKTWTQPVVRMGEIELDPFKRAAKTNVLHQALFPNLISINEIQNVCI